MSADDTQLDALIIGAHPDDAEISMGGTILLLTAAGKRVGIVDVTQGEMGTRGTVDDRRAETDAANAVMNLRVRHNLDLPDGRVEVTVEARERLALLFRQHRPRIVIAHHVRDLHPDHAATGELARQAWYISGLRRLAELDGGPPAARPPRLMHFMGHVGFEPTAVVDIGPVWERKVELVRCYRSQLDPADADDRGEHFLFGSDILRRMETKARAWGERIGVRYGEPLLHEGPIPVSDIGSILPAG